ncbi:hypothetical protein ACQ4M4_18690 [Leptolyngbya sp. AN02str]|uniref:hypothetical protein n=1 Tax=Leptolyngbya sp. AN02str TaxID=3423363 RepID=UPI003D318FCC
MSFFFRNSEIVEFQQLIAHLKSINSDIRLKLPASQYSIQRQVRQIQQSQACLQKIQHNAKRTFRRCRTPSTRAVALVLSEVLTETLQLATNYKMLGEEFAADPHGTVDCLNLIHQRSSELAERLHELEALEIFKQRRVA